MRKTKIVCTLGPAVDDIGLIKELMGAGMDVARFNFSHGTHEEQATRLSLLKAARKELMLPVATMLDTKGPEIRVGLFKNGEAFLKDSAEFILTTREIEGDDNEVSISYKGLPGEVSPGTRVLIDDGLIELTVTKIIGTEIFCKVLNGGKISNRKSVNIPSVQLKLPYMTDRDVADINFALDNDFDYIAASFVRNADDIMQIRKIFDDKGVTGPQIIAKIENEEGVENIDEILNISDGIMVARGDLGVEIPLEDIPAVQKKLIEKAFRIGKPVITATQMLDSMIKNPRPTRAEATDVANAVYDGTSALMLSGETAAGAHPILAVQTMARIAIRTEQNINYKKSFFALSIEQIANHHEEPNITDAIAHATCTTSYDLQAAAIISVTKSGNTARCVSKYRPSVSIIGCTPDIKVYRQLSLVWGVIPFLVDGDDGTDNPLATALDQTTAAGLVNTSDLVVITAGLPFGVVGSTNLLRVHIVGDEKITDF